MAATWPAPAASTAGMSPLVVAHQRARDHQARSERDP